MLMNTYYVAGIPFSDELYHYGIKGQKWNVRRFQNKDGSYTQAGRDRYGIGSSDSSPFYQRVPTNLPTSNSSSSSGTGSHAGKASSGRKSGKTRHQPGEKPVTDKDREVANRFKRGLRSHKRTQYDLTPLEREEAKSDKFRSKVEKEIGKQKYAKTLVSKAKTAVDAAGKALTNVANIEFISGKKAKEAAEKANKAKSDLTIETANRQHQLALDKIKNNQTMNSINRMTDYVAGKTKRDAEFGEYYAKKRLAESVSKRNPEDSKEERTKHANEEALLERRVEQASKKAKEAKKVSANVDALASRRAEQFATKEKNAKKSSANTSALLERRAEQLSNKARQEYNRTLRGVSENTSAQVQQYANQMQGVIEEAYSDVAEFLGSNAKKAKKAADKAKQTISKIGSQTVSSISSTAGAITAQVASFFSGLFGKKK